MKAIPAITAFVLALAMVSGCQWHALPTPAAARQQMVTPPSKALYLYTAAQLERRSGRLDRAAELLWEAIAADPGSAWLQLELARLAVERGEVAEAVGILEKSLETNPEHTPSLHLLGVLNEQLDRPEAASALFEKVIRLDPDAENAYLFLGSLYRKANDWDNARRVYAQMVAHFPSSYIGHLFLGQVAGQLSRFDEAETHLGQALSLEPEMEAPRFELIQVYQRLALADTVDRSERIIRLYEEILALDPNNAKAVFELSRIYDKLNQTEAVRQLIAPLAVRSRTDPGPIQVFIELFWETRDFAAAAVLLDYMVAADPGNQTLDYFRGVVLNELDRKDEALASFARVGPDSEYFHNASAQMAFVFQQQGRIPEAIERLNRLLDQDSENPELLLYVGSFYEEMGDYPQATTFFEKGLKLAPDNPSLLFRLGVVYDKAGRKQESIAAMRAAIERDPDNASALNFLGYTYADLGQNLDEAHDLIQKALRLKPDDGYITDSLGWVYFQKGNFRQALDYIRRAVTLVPQDPVILEHLGDVYAKLGRYAEALEAYEKALGHAEKDRGALTDKILKVRQSLEKTVSP